MPNPVTNLSWIRVAVAMTAVGWGANQFASMLLVYRAEDGLLDEVSTAMLAAYVAGIIPGLLVAAWLSAHVGKRRVLRPVMVVGIVASVAMVLGAEQPGWLFVGRVLAGVAAGGAMGPGTAWVKELTVDAPVGTGARRAAVALTGGFAIGPFVAAFVSWWTGGSGMLGGSQVAPYLVHLAVMLVGTAMVWRCPELDRGDHPTPSIAHVRQHLGSAWFVRLLVPIAPWVFIATNMSFVVLPLLLAPTLGATSALLAGVAALGTMGTGIVVQPWVKQLEQRQPGFALPGGLVLLAIGMALTVATYLLQEPWLMLITTPVFGCAYGFSVVAGLQLVERHSTPWMLAPITAAFYCLAYVGFAAPLLFAALFRLWPAELVVGATGLLALIVVAATYGRSRAEGALRRWSS